MTEMTTAENDDDDDDDNDDDGDENNIMTRVMGPAITMMILVVQPFETWDRWNVGNGILYRREIRDG